MSGVVERRTVDLTPHEIDTGIKIFGGTVTNVENSEPKITLVIRCSKKMDQPYHAQELKENLRAKSQLQ